MGGNRLDWVLLGNIAQGDQCQPVVCPNNRAVLRTGLGSDILCHNMTYPHHILFACSLKFKTKLKKIYIKT